MSVYQDLKSASARAGGSHLTREARQLTITRFSEYLKDNNIQIKGAEHVREKHIIGYLAQRDIATRPKQNELSHLRVSLRECGRADFADRLGTQRMGVDKATREGTHRAITDTEYAKARGELVAKDAGCAAAAALCRELGLRSKEAVILQRDSLERFERQLVSLGKVEVVEGTKGGRDRWVHPANQERALVAVREAIAASKQNAKGYVVEGKGKNLKSALDKFHRVAAECGMKGKISPHSLRYAYACERLDQKIAEGYSRREALVIVSHDLGHGDGRDTFVLQVYSKR